MPEPIVSRSEYLINSITGNDQDEAAIAALVTGDFAIAWTSNNGVATDDDVRYTLRQASGDAFSTSFDDEILRASAVVDEFRPVAAGLPDGRSVFVWEENTTGENDLYALVRNADGTLLKNRFAVTAVTANVADDQTLAGVIGLANGNFMVAYQNQFPLSLSAVVYDIAGNPVAGPTTVSPSGMLGSTDNRVQLARLSNGNAVLTWTAGLVGSEQQRIAIVDAAGAVVEADADVNPEDAVVESSGGSVLTLADGNFVVLFERDADANDIQGRLFDQTGAAIGGRFDISTGAANASPRGVGLADGRFMVVYGNGNDIFGQMMFADGTMDGARFTVSNAAGSQTAPELDLLADGRVVVTWTSDQNGNQDIFAEIYDPRETALNASASGLDDHWIGTGLADRVYLGTGNDEISAGIGNDTIYGEAGNDTLDGDEDNDKLYGGNDNDTLNGGSEDDTLNGDLGSDTLNSDAGSDTLNGGEGNDTLNGGTESDILNGNDGNDTLLGDAGQDVANGGGGDDTIDGGADKDTLNGDDGNDVLEGGDIGDTLRGGNGDDYLSGGPGGDVLLGGAGFDTFSYLLFTTDGNDRIDDWVAADDQIEVGAPTFNLPPGPLAADRLVVSAAPVANQAFPQFLYNTTSGQLSWDSDGTGAAVAIAITRLLNGGVAVGTLTAADFDVII